MIALIKSHPYLTAAALLTLGYLAWKGMKKSATGLVGDAARNTPREEAANVPEQVQ